MLKHPPLSLRMSSIGLLTTLCFSGALIWLRSRIRTSTYEIHDQKIQNLVQTAWSVANHYGKQADSGAITTQQARDAARQVIKSLRFGVDNYFWINDLQPTMIMHPTNPALDGKDLSGLKDADGIPIFVNMSEKNAQKASAGHMTEISQLVVDANGKLAEMKASMDEINASSGKISKIIRVIDEIAFQTNILSLNAAVEAARAGEAGMGFAVVAEEVRNLAQRSSQAAKDTASLIEEWISRSKEGGVKLAGVVESISNITGSSAQVKILVDEVQTGSQEQARGIEQISKTLSNMEHLTQQVAANS